MQRKYPRIIATTDDYLVVYKDHGVPFHAEREQDGRKTGRPGILQILRDMESEGAIASGARLYPVHRLDQVTSGLLVFARGRKNANLLSNEFRHRRVTKFYLALSDRRPKKKQGRVSGDMTRGRRGGWILTRTHKNPAVTNFLSKSVPGARPGLRLYLLRPRTGKTHQLRVAMKSLGAPILGDGLYGRFDLAREEDRAYLHAYGLEFKLGGNTVRLIEAPDAGHEFSTPAFRKALREYADPFQIFKSDRSEVAER